MADDYDDGSAEVFVAVVAFILLIALSAYLIYTGVIHDWMTGGIAVGSLVLYVVVCMLISPYVIAAGPTKSQSGYDGDNYATRSITGEYRSPKNQRISPAGYLFAIIMPGYFIGKSVLWLAGLFSAGGEKTTRKK